VDITLNIVSTTCNEVRQRQQQQQQRIVLVNSQLTQESKRLQHLNSDFMYDNTYCWRT